MQRHLTKITYAYIMGSVVIGPGILALGNALFPQRLACFDIVPTGPHHDIIVNARGEFLFDSILSAALIILGVLLIKRLSTKQTIGLTHRLFLESAISVMIIGYALIMLLMGFDWHCVATST